LDELSKYEGKSKTQVINMIRKEWMTCSQKRVAIERCVKRITLPSGRKKSLVECQGCKELFERDECNAHHLDPVGPLLSTKPEDIASYRERMFPKACRIAPLCHSCHHKQHHK
jgi:hypothetical protein